MSISPSDLLQRANKLYYIGQHTDALSLLQHGIEQMADNPDTALELELQSLKFAVQSIYFHNVSADQTIELLQEKLQSPLIDTESPSYYDIKDLLGLAHYYHQIQTSTPDFSNALPPIEEAMKFRQAQDNSKLAHSFFHLGLIHQHSGRLEEAHQHFQQAREQSNDNPLLQSSILRYLGIHSQKIDDLEQAKSYLETSLQIRLDHGYLVLIPFSCISLGDCFLELGLHDRALHLYEKAKEIASTVNIELALSLSHLSLGHYHMQLSNFDEALHANLEAYFHARLIKHEAVISTIRSRLQVVQTGLS